MAGEGFRFALGPLQKLVKKFSQNDTYDTRLMLSRHRKWLRILGAVLRASGSATLIVVPETLRFLRMFLDGSSILYLDAELVMALISLSRWDLHKLIGVIANGSGIATRLSPCDRRLRLFWSSSSTTNSTNGRLQELTIPWTSFMTCSMTQLTARWLLSFYLNWQGAWMLECQGYCVESSESSWRRQLCELFLLLWHSASN